MAVWLDITEQKKPVIPSVKIRTFSDFISSFYEFVMPLSKRKFRLVLRVNKESSTNTGTMSIGGSIGSIKAN